MESTIEEDLISVDSSEELRQKIDASSLGRGITALNNDNEDKDIIMETEDNSTLAPSMANTVYTQDPLTTQVAEMFSTPAASGRTSTTTAAKKTTGGRKYNRSGESKLPPDFEGLTIADRDKFTIIEDEDGVPTVSHVFVGNKSYDLCTDLMLSQLRKLASNLGVKNHHKAKKEICCNLIAQTILDEAKLEAAGIHPETSVNMKSCSVIRLINCLFSEDFFDRFTHINDLHTRITHESGQTYKQFWVDLAIYYNNKDDGDDEVEDELLKIYNAENDEILYEFQQDCGTNLSNFNKFTEDAIRKLVKDLFRVRSKIKELMTQSGHHSNSPWDYVQAGLKEVNSLTKIAAYYFFCRCNEHPDIDNHFKTFLDDDIKGSTVDIGSATSSITTNFEMGKRRKRVASDITEARNNDFTSAELDILAEIKRGNQEKENQAKRIADATVDTREIKRITGMIKGKETEMKTLMYFNDTEKINQCLQELKNYQNLLLEMGQNDLE